MVHSVKEVTITIAIGIPNMNRNKRPVGNRKTLINKICLFFMSQNTIAFKNMKDAFRVLKYLKKERTYTL